MYLERKSMGRWIVMNITPPSYLPSAQPFRAQDSELNTRGATVAAVKTLECCYCVKHTTL